MDMQIALNTSASELTEFLQAHYRNRFHVTHPPVFLRRDLGGHWYIEYDIQDQAIITISCDDVDFKNRW